MERIVVLTFCLIVVGLLGTFFVLSLKSDEKNGKKKRPKTLGDTIVTAQGVVVSFRANPKKLETFLLAGGANGVSQTLRDMLTANAQTDLKQFEDALGIIVTALDRPKPREIDGVLLGDESE